MIRVTSSCCVPCNSANCRLHRASASGHEHRAGTCRVTLAPISALYAAPVPAIEYREPVPLVECVVPARAASCVTPAPSVYAPPTPVVARIEPAPVVGYIEPVPVDGYVSPAPATSHVANCDHYGNGRDQVLSSKRQCSGTSHRRLLRHAWHQLQLCAPCQCQWSTAACRRPPCQTSAVQATPRPLVGFSCTSRHRQPSATRHHLRLCTSNQRRWSCAS